MSEPVNIVIVSWNAIDFTRETVNSLFRYTDAPYYLTLVDNASTDGTQAYLQSLSDSPRPEQLKGVKVILNNENRAYSGATLQGHAAFDTPRVVVANNDLELSPGWLGKMNAIMDQNPDIGILGTLRPAPFCMHPYARIDTSSFIGDIQLADQRDPINELMSFTGGKDWETFVADLENSNSRDILWLPGHSFVVTCLAMIDSETAKRVGGVAREELRGCEDVDLSWRIVHHGGKKAAVAPLYIHHHKHASSSINRQDRDELSLKYDRMVYEYWKKYIKGVLQKGIEGNPHFIEEIRNKVHWEHYILRKLEKTIGIPELWDGVEGTRILETSEGSGEYAVEVTHPIIRGERSY